ncbi:MAG: DedA family protein [Planctomycetota bacterium]|nr:MAG: DedA family protein [Planctomycetota bacterium]
MHDWLLKFAESAGYWGVAALMVLENIFPPIPSEVVMPWAGYAAGNGQMQLLGVIAAGSVGSVLGTLPWYYVGKWVGSERLQQWAARHGAWLALSSGEVERALKWFESRGSITVLVCRLVPGVRTLISVPAGVVEMSMPKFLALTVIGTVAWTAALACLGWYLRDQYTLVETYLGPAGMVVVGALIAWWLVRLVRQQGWLRRSSG